MYKIYDIISDYRRWHRINKTSYKIVWTVMGAKLCSIHKRVQAPHKRSAKWLAELVQKPAVSQ